jgi:phage shock protein PspC (stress-responsive transcriptional regulator)
MNKVVNIQLAGQVFTLDEDAYKLLTDYLEQIKKELERNEDAGEIQEDIELRLAELMYSVLNKNRQHIRKQDIEAFIEQIGFLDPQTTEEEKTQFGSINNYRILAAVCFELSQRSKIPSFIIRLLFVASIFAAGLGIVLYIILFFSLSVKQNPKTLKQVESDKNKILIQRVLFFPFYFLGLFYSATLNLFKSHQSVLTTVFKSIITIPILILIVFAFAGLYEMANYRVLSGTAQFLFGIAASMIIFSFSWYYVNKVFLLRKRQLFSRELIHVLKACVLYLLVITAYLIYSLSSSASKEKRLKFKADFNQLEFRLEPLSANSNESYVRYYIIPKTDEDSTIVIETTYESAGKNTLDAERNVEMIQFDLNLEDSLLILPSHFKLSERAFYREQYVRVKIYVPNNLMLKSNFQLAKHSWSNTNVYHINKSSKSDLEAYIFYNNIIFNQSAAYKNHLSKYEKSELIQLIGRAIIKVNTRSYSNILTRDNYEDVFEKYLKTEYKAVFSDLRQIRNILSSTNTIGLKQLDALLKITAKLESTHPNLEAVSIYLEALKKAKTI